MDELIEFLTARLDEAQRSLEESGPHPVAWLTYRDAEGGMLYTTVASSADEYGESGIWISDGEELAEPSSARVIYDPARERREVEAKRVRLALIVSVLADQLPAPTADPKVNMAMNEGGKALAEALLLAEALPYSGDPGFKEEWKSCLP